VTADGTRPGTITVPGRGSVRVAPDVATLRLGVAIVRPTAGEARSAAVATMGALIDAIAAGGVERRDLRTALVGLDAVREYSGEGAPRVTGYQLTNSLEVTVRAIDAVGGLIDAALAAGATSMDAGGADPAVQKASAAAGSADAAIAEAAAAETLAAEAGVTLGRVVEIVEDGALPPGPPRPFLELRAKLAPDAATPIEGGTDELEVGLTVSFAID